MTVDGSQEQVSVKEIPIPQTVASDFNLVKSLIVLRDQGAWTRIPGLDSPLFRLLNIQKFREDLAVAGGEFERKYPVVRDKTSTQPTFLSFLSASKDKPADIQSRNKYLAEVLTASWPLADKLAKEYYLQYELRETVRKSLNLITQTYKLTDQEKKQFEEEAMKDPFIFSQIIISESDKDKFPEISKTLFPEEKEELKKIAAMTHEIIIEPEDSAPPELVNMMRFLMARTGGLDYATACRPEKYSADTFTIINWKDTPLYKGGVKIHVNLDRFTNPALFQVIDAVRQVLPANYCWKISELTPDGAWGDKLITIFLPADGDKDPGLSADSNFRTVIKTVKKLDKELCRRKLTAGELAPESTNLAPQTDANIGKSGLISVRYADYCYARGVVPIPADLQGWSDDRNRSFKDNFPSEDLLRAFMKKAEKAGLKIELRLEEEKESIAV